MAKRLDKGRMCIPQYKIHYNVEYSISPLAQESIERDNGNIINSGLKKCSLVHPWLNLNRRAEGEAVGLVREG